MVHEQEWKYRGLTGAVVDASGRTLTADDVSDEVLRFIAAAPDMAQALLDDVRGIVETVPEGQWSPETARKVAALRKGGVL